ncbi:DUF2142 domain-containing protein [Pseudarthrobacter sp. PH31-O2]|uniref:DUF2142 domain-containing protein n=1 Tax=Pseudarthrobacter sp. PH31-O2 TaxID=3046206 RepID=UPI0024B8F168|nr:DUF2142 domain-containing protein [Pseudarthrobacter sp. PH31-O2]MDJ0351176.1 DUF2142 domain-containing protein [Pseudarthrobacter sp. PH31-O2]
MDSTAGRPAAFPSHDNRMVLRQFLRTFAFLSLLTSLWSLATPLMAFPDEVSHTIKAAAVARGQFVVQAGQSYGHGVHVQVPSYIANLSDQTCTAFKREMAASCAPSIPLDDNYLTIGVTSAGMYNPMYYWIVGLPSLIFSGAPALFAMRIVSAVLSSAFLAAGFTALTRLRAPKWPVAAAAVAVTPMVLFLAAGINPNSLEITATMAAFCGLLVCLENSRNLAVVKPAILTVGISAVVLANTRNVSLVWLLAAVTVAVTFFGFRRVGMLFHNRTVLVTSGAMAVGVGLGLWWIVLMIFAPGSTAAAPDGITNLVEGVKPHQAFLTMLDRVFDFVPQYIGVMGWLDTPVPQAVVQYWSMLLMLALLIPLTSRQSRRALGFWVALLALAILPAIIQAGLITTVGYIWQGRYNLPLFMILVIAAGMSVRNRSFESTPELRNVGRVIIAAGAVAHVYSFIYLLRRYVVGLHDTGNWQVMITHPEWQPPLSWIGLSALYAGLIYLGSAGLYRYLFPSYELIDKFRGFSGSPAATGSEAPRS